MPIPNSNILGKKTSTNNLLVSTLRDAIFTFALIVQIASGNYFNGHNVIFFGNFTYLPLFSEHT